MCVCAARGGWGVFFFHDFFFFICAIARRGGGRGARGVVGVGVPPSLTDNI